MSTEQKAKLFIFEEHPLMTLGVEALIKQESDFEFRGSSRHHENLFEELSLTKPDALVIDLSLYSEKSVHFLRQLRDRFPKLKIILLSIHTGREFVDRAREGGADAYVLKTDDPDCIIEAIRESLAGRSYVSKSIRAPSREPLKLIDSPINLLSAEEFQILQRIGKGHTNRRIAEDLAIPIQTVEEEIGAIQRKLDLPTPIELLQFAFHWVHHEGGFS